MADRPLHRLARLIGGIALMQGRLGHQILGQLLITDATELEVAGASAVVAVSSGQRNVLADAALRVVAPALATHRIAKKAERRIVRLNQLALRRDQQSDRRERALRDWEERLKAREAGVAERERALPRGDG